MRRLAVLLAAAVMLLAIAAPAGAAPSEKTWVCHATGSASNPWILVHVANGWDNGHGNGGPAVHQNVDDVYTGELPDHPGPLGKLGLSADDCGEEENPEQD
jgi:hypothetical protein